MIKKYIITLTLIFCISSTHQTFALLDNITAWVKGEKIKEDKHTAKHKLCSESTISVSNLSGNITIKTWDQNEVVVTVLKKGFEFDVDNTDVQFLKGADHLTCLVVAKEDDIFCNVDFQLLIPETSQLQLIKTIDGSVTINNTKRPISIEIENGNIIAQDIESTIISETQKGSIEITCKNLKKSHKIHAKTENGDISLSLQEGINAKIKATTLKGAVTSTIDITLDPIKMKINSKTISELKKNISGTISKPETDIILQCQKGSISISKN